MSCDNCDTTYNDSFIEDLQDKIQTALAKSINQQNSNRKFDLGVQFNNKTFIKLVEYNNILTKIKNCDSCFSKYNIEEIISIIKSNLNRL